MPDACGGFKFRTIDGGGKASPDDASGGGEGHRVARIDGGGSHNPDSPLADHACNFADGVAVSRAGFVSHSNACKAIATQLDGTVSSAVTDRKPKGHSGGLNDLGRNVLDRLAFGDHARESRIHTARVGADKVLNLCH